MGLNDRLQFLVGPSQKKEGSLNIQRKGSLMTTKDEQNHEPQNTPAVRRRAKVFVMPTRSVRNTPNTAAPSAPKITQERLRQGIQFLTQEFLAVRAMREFTLAMETDLAAGATIEGGELTFDQMLKVIRSSSLPKQKQSVREISKRG